MTTVVGGQQKWQLRHHPNVKSSSEASFPAQTLPIPPRFIRLTAGSESANFRAHPRRGAEGFEIFVSPETWQKIDNGTECTFRSISKIRYNWERLLGESRGRIVLVGLSILIVGTLIQGSLAVGRIQPFFVFTDKQLAALAIVGLVLQIIGFVLTFFERELLKSD
jgi:hypothetical protein